MPGRGFPVSGATAIADRVGIPHLRADRRYFRIARDALFAEGYIRGKKPHLCVFCYEHGKYRRLFEEAGSVHLHGDTRRKPEHGQTKPGKYHLHRTDTACKRRRPSAPSNALPAAKYGGIRDICLPRISPQAMIVDIFGKSSNGEGDFPDLVGEVQGMHR